MLFFLGLRLTFRPEPKVVAELVRAVQMARDYVLTTFLRDTPRESLAAYFHCSDISIPVNFSGKRKPPIDSLLRVMRDLDSATRARIESDFYLANRLSSAEGTKLIFDLMHLHGREHMDPLAAMPNHHARAMWLFLNPLHSNRNVLKACLAIDEALAAKFTSSKRLKGLPTNSTVRSDPATCEQIAGEVRDLYVGQGRGYRCLVEHYERLEPRRHFFIAYPEDYSHSYQHFDGDKLERRDYQSVFQAVYVFRPDSGRLDLSASGTRKETRVLQDIFCRRVLGLKGIPEQATERCFDLSPLLERPNLRFETDPSDGIESVRVIALWMSHIENPGKKLCLDLDASLGETMHDWIQEAVNQSRVPLSKLVVNKARFQVGWANDGDSTPRRKVTFDIVSPGTCSLKEEAQHLLISKYLKQWTLET